MQSETFTMRTSERRTGRSNMTYQHVTAPTQFVEANGIRFAYRRFGQEGGTPLLFMQHFRGGMDHWDPAVTDGFAKNEIYATLPLTPRQRLRSIPSRFKLNSSRFRTPKREEFADMKA